GCTGGIHRSVYITEKLAQCFKNQGNTVLVHHRQLIK
ncbi:RNase adapter RapZ, partial [Escherichia coli]|nr:RNase adapter RapZ [Escherichia coli]